MPPRGTVVRFLVLVLAMGACGAWLAMSGVRSPTELPVFIADSGLLLGPVVVVGVSTLLLVALVPRSLVTASAGLAFGGLAGAAYAFTASVLAAMVAFAAGRWLGRDFVASRASVARVDAWVARRGAWGVIVVRLLPVAPFGLTSYAFGVTGVPLRAYLVGTALGSVPATLVYASLGAAAMRPGSSAFLWSLAAAVVLGLGGAVATAARRRRDVPR